MKKELWLRLRRYRFDELVPAHLADRVASMFGGMDASTRAFAGKVARKHGWTVPFSLHAIAEYKKFVYLGMVADFSVTPPKAIDAVWHEHLLFSRAYRDFCRTVLERDFDHHPELLPERAQSEAFRAQYESTLALYETEFDTTPPVDVWGSPKFGPLDGSARNAPRRRDRDGGASGVATSDTTPLYAYFESSGAGSDASTGDAGFGGGGGFSGGGGGSGWSGDSPPGAESSDAGTSDAGSSSDGGGDGGGSGCSSSCGGGGE